MRKLAEPERRSRMLALLTDGVPRVHACHGVGISEDTLARELASDAEFAEAIKGAEGEAVVRCVELIAKAAEAGSWQAAAWFLERRHPREFGRRTVLAADEPDAGPPHIRLAFPGEEHVT